MGSKTSMSPLRTPLLSTPHPRSNVRPPILLLYIAGNVCLSVCLSVCMSVCMCVCMCVSLGVYANVSEDTHWTPFINASVNYIRTRYPPPWDIVRTSICYTSAGCITQHPPTLSLLHALMSSCRDFIELRTRSICNVTVRQTDRRTPGDSKDRAYA